MAFATQKERYFLTVQNTKTVKPRSRRYIIIKNACYCDIKKGGKNTRAFVEMYPTEMGKLFNKMIQNNIPIHSYDEGSNINPAGLNPAYIGETEQFESRTLANINHDTKVIPELLKPIKFVK